MIWGNPVQVPHSHDSLVDLDISHYELPTFLIDKEYLVDSIKK